MEKIDNQQTVVEGIRLMKAKTGEKREMAANVSGYLSGRFAATTVTIFSGVSLQMSAVYLLIVCFLNIGYQTEN